MAGKVASKISKFYKKGLIERYGTPIIVVTYLMAFLIGILFEKVNNIQGGNTTTSKATPTTQAAQQQPQQPAQVNVTMDQIKKVWSADVVKFGDQNRKVLFIDISDPSCPYCHIASGSNPELSKQAGDRFTYVSDGGTYIPPVPEFKKLLDQGKASYAFIYFPGHGNGEMGARALFCANDQGKYWQVHSLLFSNKGYDLLNNTVKNDKSKAGDLATFLASAADSSTMKSCLESSKYDQRLTSNQALAQSLGVQGTPGFFVNTQLFAGAYSYKDMEPTVTAALK